VAGAATVRADGDFAFFSVSANQIIRFGVAAPTCGQGGNGCKQNAGVQV